MLLNLKLQEERARESQRASQVKELLTPMMEINSLLGRGQLQSSSHLERHLQLKKQMLFLQTLNILDQDMNIQSKKL
jgi:hypothetical protein